MSQELEIHQDKSTLVSSTQGNGLHTFKQLNGFDIKAHLDPKVLTAMAFPRDTYQVMDDIERLALKNIEIAEACYYARPGNKTTDNPNPSPIFGPSIRLAEIAASFWGNIEIGSSVISQDENRVTVKGYARDLQKNYTVEREVTRSIRTSMAKGNKLYSPNMIENTILAASSIAMRNAILVIIPRAFINMVFNKAMDMVKNGVVNSPKGTQDFNQRCDRTFQTFAKYNISEEIILGYFGYKNRNELNSDDFVVLTGIHTSIKEGHLDAKDAFNRSEVIINNDSSSSLEDQLQSLADTISTKGE